MENQYLNDIAEELRSGRLSLFCGAGVSIDAGIPDWQSLISRLLPYAFFEGRQASSREGRYHADRLIRSFPKSPIVMSRYIKSALGDCLNERLLQELYIRNPEKSLLLNAIGKACETSDSRRGVKSILTFNFDDLIDRELKRREVPHVVIDEAGRQAGRNEVSVFHAHGYLPRDFTEKGESRLIFSEDAYHARYEDQYHWANLCQLNLLANSTCLFLGLSLSDPNLRRLLDVAHDQFSHGQKNHYIFMRRHSVFDLDRVENRNLSENPHIIDFFQRLHSIEESDANALGINVIWVERYEDIPRQMLEICALSDAG